MEKEQNKKHGNYNSMINHNSNGFQSEHDNSSDKIMEINLDKETIKSSGHNYLQWIL